MSGWELCSLLQLKTPRKGEIHRWRNLQHKK